jgi:hypothetical protein
MRQTFDLQNVAENVGGSFVDGNPGYPKRLDFDQRKFEHQLKDTAMLVINNLVSSRLHGLQTGRGE